MLKRISSWILTFLILAGAALLIRRAVGPAKARPLAAYINEDALPKDIKESKDFQAHLAQAASYAAAKRGYSLVLDKKTVVGGAVDATADVLSYFEGNSKVGNIRNEPIAPAPVAVIDEEALFKLPEFQNAREQYLGLYNNLKEEYRRKSAGLSDADQEALMQDYSERLAAAQKELAEPVFGRLESTIRAVAEEKGLVCVFSKRDVLYGGTDITQDVFVSAKEKVGNSAPAGRHANSPIAIAVVDPSKLIPVHPLALRAKELDREIQSWESGRYGIALTLLSPKERDEWEEARLNAQKDWENRLQALTRNERPDLKIPQLTPQKMSEIEAALNQAYQEEFSKKLAALQNGFNAQFKEGEKAADSSLRSYWDDLQKFRVQKLSSRESELLAKLERDVKTEETRLEEEYLQYEKQLMDADQQKKLNLQLKLEVASANEKTALENRLDAIESAEDDAKNQRRSELAKELADFQDRGLVSVKATLKGLSQTLDAEAEDKIKERRQELMTASKEALSDEQDNLKAQVSDLRAQAAKEARKKVAGRFGFRLTEPIFRQAELNRQMAELRLGIEAKLAAEEKKILTQSKNYNKISEAIEKGDRNIVQSVISDLQKEERNVTETMQKDIFAEALARGKEEGFNLIVTGAALNVGAHDLTRELAREYTAASSQDLEEVKRHS